MSRLAMLVPRLGVFAVAAVVGAFVASIVVAALADRTPVTSVVAALADRTPVTSVGDAPDYLMTGAVDTPGAEALPVAFDLDPSGEQPRPLATLSPADLALAADALIGAEPVTFLNPSGFPRIPPVTQWDGGPFANANCTLASGAMLARLGYGIVTTGSLLRTLQDDQEGGTGLDDLSTALWRGYGVSFPSGLLRPVQLRRLLTAGYGVVVQGDYSKIPESLRLQRSFTGSHAIYLDGYYPGNEARGVPEAYYVIDPLGRPGGGYEGDWWPATLIHAFGRAFGGGRIPAMWAFPPGGSPPDVVGADVLPIPSSGGGGGGESPAPGESPSPGESPATPAPPILVLEPGDAGPSTIAPWSPIDPGVIVGDVFAIPALQFCLIEPPPAGCPTGIEAVFNVGDPPLLQLPLGPDVDIVFVASDRPNVAIVGFTVDPPTSSTVRFWEADGSPATIGTPSSMSTVSLFGSTIILARLDVHASTTYHVQAVAGSGLLAGLSDVGTFTTGDGVVAFDVVLSQAASPRFETAEVLSPYVHLAPDAYAAPLVRLDSLGGATCLGRADFGGTGYCLDLGASAAPAACTRAEVSWELAGIDATEVLVRAFPAAEGVAPDGGLVLDGVLEADGAAPSGSVSVGCLASGLAYHVVIDAVGDDRGILASETVTAP